MTQEQEFEFRARAEAEAAQSRASAKPSLGDQAASFAKQHGRELATGLGAGLGGISGGVLGAAAGGIGALPGGVAGSGLGAAAGGQLYDIAEHYLGGTPTAPMGQRMTQLGKDVGFGATTEMGGQVAGKIIGAGIGAGAKALKYGTEAKAIADTAKREATALLLQERGAATTAARRAETKSMTQGQRAANLLSKQAVAEKAATPKPFTEGNVTTLSERGKPVQDAAMSAKAKILSARKEEYNVLKKPVNDTVAAKEAAGEYISDIPEAKALLKESRNVVNPSGIKSKTATSLPTREEAAVHRKVIDALADRRVEVPESYVKSPAAADAKIITVNTLDPLTGTASPTYYRVFKTQYEAVDNLRRRFGDAFQGKDATGFEGVPEALIKDTYGKIGNIQRNYVGKDLYDPPQESYAAYTKMLAPYNETLIGKSLSGTQGSTGIARMTPSQIPGAVLGKGSGGLAQAKALGASDTKLLSDQLATALYDPATKAPVSAAKARSLLHDTQLGDAVSANPALKEAVKKHITQLEDAEMMGVRAKDFGKRAEVLATKSGKTAKVAEKATEKARGYEVDASSLQSLPYDKIASRAETIFNDMAKNNVISRQKHSELLSAVRSAEKELTKEALRKRIIGLAATAAGLGAASKVGADVYTGMKD